MSRSWLLFWIGGVMTARRYHTFKKGKVLGNCRVLDVVDNKSNIRGSRYRVQCLSCGHEMLLVHETLMRRQTRGTDNCTKCRKRVMPTPPRVDKNRAIELARARARSRTFKVPAGATLTSCGLYYKYGVHGKLYRWTDDEWVLASPENRNRLSKIA